MKVDYKYTRNGREHAARMFNRNDNFTALKVEIEFGTGTVEVELTVNEAEAAAKDLLDYVEEIKEYAAYLKSLEEATQ